MSAEAPLIPLRDGDAFDPVAVGGVGWAKWLLGRQLHIVGRMAQKGLEIAGSLIAEWKTPPAPGAAPEHTDPRERRSWFAATYAKVTRAFRLAQLLKERLVRELKKLDRLSAGAKRDTEGGSGDTSRQRELQALLRRLAADEGAELDDDLKDEWEDEDEEEREDQIDRESLDRLPPDPLRRYVMSRPVGELISEIRRDLGLSLDWLEQVTDDYDRAQAGQHSEVRRAAGGRGLQPPAPPPPSSASATLPPRGEDRVPRRPDDS